MVRPARRNLMVLAVAAVGVAGPGAASASAQAPQYPIPYPVPGPTTVVPGGTTVIPGPAGPDTTSPFLTIPGDPTASLRQGAVIVDVIVDEASTLNADGTVAVPALRAAKLQAAQRKRARRFKLGSATANAEPKVQVRLRLPFSRKAKSAIRQGLRRGRRSTARVNITATDLAGNKTSVTKTIRVKK